VLDGFDSHLVEEVHHLSSLLPGGNSGPFTTFAVILTS
jgi:hypothetical protein